MSWQTLLWMEPDHPLVMARLTGICMCALPAVRELYEYISSPRYVAHRFNVVQT
jgi:phosphatidylserine synthase 2